MVGDHTKPPVKKEKFLKREDRELQREKKFVAEILVYTHRFIDSFFILPFK